MVEVESVTVTLGVYALLFVVMIVASLLAGTYWKPEDPKEIDLEAMKRRKDEIYAMKREREEAQLRVTMVGLLEGKHSFAEKRIKGGSYALHEPLLPDASNYQLSSSRSLMDRVDDTSQLPTRGINGGDSTAHRADINRTQSSVGGGAFTTSCTMPKEAVASLPSRPRMAVAMQLMSEPSGSNRWRMMHSFRKEPEEGTKAQESNSAAAADMQAPFASPSPSRIRSTSRSEGDDEKELTATMSEVHTSLHRFSSMRHIGRNKNFDTTPTNEKSLRRRVSFGGVNVPPTSKFGGRLGSPISGSDRGNSPLTSILRSPESATLASPGVLPPALQLSGIQDAVDYPTPGAVGIDISEESPQRSNSTEQGYYNAAVSERTPSPPKTHTTLGSAMNAFGFSTDGRINKDAMLSDDLL